MTEAQYVRRVGEQTDAYDRTIHALFGVDSLLRYDEGGYVPDSLFLPGRTMDSGDGPSQTPDIVVQLSPDSGIVGEVKITASSERDYAKAQEQVTRYDTELTGWCTDDGSITEHGLFLLIDNTHAGTGMEYFRHASFQRSFCLLSMVRNDQHRPHLQFERRLGELTAEHIRRKFEEKRDIVSVGLEHLIPKFGKVKFYDSEPLCVEYTMEVLWSHYVAETKVRRHVERKRRTVEQREVDCHEAQAQLERAYGLVRTAVPPECMDRQPQVPGLEWVRRALEAFVEIGQADHDDDNADVYWVTWSARPRKRLLEGFARRLYRARARKRGRKPGDGQVQQTRMPF